MTDPIAAIRQARRGDRSAQGRLLEGYRNYLRLLARQQIGRRLQGKVDASDIVQETFLAAQRDFGEFRGRTEAALIQWLRHILAARLADTVRRFHSARARDVRLERDLVHDLDQASRALPLALMNVGSPSESAIRREQAVLLADALVQLPEHYAEVIVLRHMEGCPFVEVARRMDRSVDSVEKIWVRALAQLRRILRESAHDEGLA